MPSPLFATPLPQSPRSPILEWPLPPPHSHIVLTGRSRAAWHTSFVVPQLNLLLDAGLVVGSARPKHVFLTHGHADHALLAPVFTSRAEPPDIFCPAEMRAVLDDYLLAKTMLNRGGLVGIEDAAAQGLEVGGADGDEDDDGDGLDGHGRQRTPLEKAFLKTHFTHPLHPGDVVSLKHVAREFTATAFACDHSVPCLGYLFSSTTHRLRPEFASLPGAQLKALRESGASITAPHVSPIFAFLGDTTAATLAAAPEWLAAGIPVVITECSFLYPEHKAQADKTKHTVWCDLEPVVRRWPRTTFVLMHFSLRYSEADVAAFFRDMHDPPGNIVVWADAEG